MKNFSIEKSNEMIKEKWNSDPKFRKKYKSLKKIIEGNNIT